MKINPLFLQYSKGDVAQLEEHHNGIVGVVGSNPIISSFFYISFPDGVMVAQRFLVPLVGVRISIGEHLKFVIYWVNTKGCGIG